MNFYEVSISFTLREEQAKENRRLEFLLARFNWISESFMLRVVNASGNHVASMNV